MKFQLNMFARSAIAFALIAISTVTVADPPFDGPGSVMDMEVFADAMTYARRSVNANGLGLGAAEARTWASELAMRPGARESLEAHQAAYVQARRQPSFSGFGMNDREARTLADRLTHPYIAPGALERYARAFRYASHREVNGGLQLSSSESARFALPFAQREDGDEVLDRYRDSYTVARRPESNGGLALAPASARQFATDASGISQRLDCDLNVARSETAEWVRALKEQITPHRQPLVDSVYMSHCMNGTLDPRTLTQSLAPLLLQPQGPGWRAAGYALDGIGRINPQGTGTCVGEDDAAVHSPVLQPVGPLLRMPVLADVPR